MARMNKREFTWEESLFKKVKKVDSAALEEESKTETKTEEVNFWHQRQA